MTTIDFGAFDVLTFDTYGTLIDWESGILAALHPVLAAHGVAADDETLLERYGRHESALEAGPYMPYREVVRSRGSTRGFASRRSRTATTTCSRAPSSGSGCASTG